MWHVRRGMKQSMNSMAAVTANHAETMRLGMLLYDIANLSVLFARFDDIDSLGQAFVRHFH